MTKITVLTTDINVVSINNEDYICITDMLKAKDGDFFISDWLRNRNTLEYLGIWERLYNPGFNYGEFAIIRNQSGLNSFKISVKEYVEKTHAIGIQAKAGRYGGTYAHKDIAFEFGMWISGKKICAKMAKEGMDWLTGLFYELTVAIFRCCEHINRRNPQNIAA